VSVIVFIVCFVGCPRTSRLCVCYVEIYFYDMHISLE